MTTTCKVQVSTSEDLPISSLKYDSDSQKLPLHVLTAIVVVLYCFDPCLLLENTHHFER